MTLEFNASTRNDSGTSASRRLRHAGKVPAVVYGGIRPAMSIVLEHKAMYYAMKTDAFHTTVLSLVIDGKKEPVKITAYQMHPHKQQVLHIDFVRVQ
jgi:large subunit ribosomal protein L25